MQDVPAGDVFAWVVRQDNPQKCEATRQGSRFGALPCLAHASAEEGGRRPGLSRPTPNGSTDEWVDPLHRYTGAARDLCNPGTTRSPRSPLCGDEWTGQTRS